MKWQQLLWKTDSESAAHNNDAPLLESKPEPKPEPKPTNFPVSSASDTTTNSPLTTTYLPTLLLTTTILTILQIRNRYLRRFPTATAIHSSYFRNGSKSIFGRVTSVGDGDNFRLYHTPGGRLMGWELLPWKKIPESKSGLKDQTIHIRLAGIDAPELAHFGRPEQPHAREALDFLSSYLLHRRVRVYLHRQDQYQRVVGSAYVRRAWDFPLPFRRRDVSYEMLRRGLATVYEAKSGVEFGADGNEERYRQVEAWAREKGKGLWRGFKGGVMGMGRGRGKGWESPREYKRRFQAEEGR